MAHFGGRTVTYFTGSYMFCLFITDDDKEKAENMVNVDDDNVARSRLSSVACAEESEL